MTRRCSVMSRHTDEPDVKCGPAVAKVRVFRRRKSDNQLRPDSHWMFACARCVKHLEAQHPDLVAVRPYEEPPALAPRHTIDDA